MPITIIQFPPTRGDESSAFCQFETAAGFCSKWKMPTPMTTRLSRR